MNLRPRLPWGRFFVARPGTKFEATAYRSVPFLPLFGTALVVPPRPQLSPALRPFPSELSYGKTRIRAKSRTRLRAANWAMNQGSLLDSGGSSIPHARMEHSACTKCRCGKSCVWVLNERSRSLSGRGRARLPDQDARQAENMRPLPPAVVLWINLGDD
jgi:hypothetical protein